MLLQIKGMGREKALALREAFPSPLALWGFLQREECCERAEATIAAALSRATSGGTMRRSKLARTVIRVFQCKDPEAAVEEAIEELSLPATKKIRKAAFLPVDVSL